MTRSPKWRFAAFSLMIGALTLPACSPGEAGNPNQDEAVPPADTMPSQRPPSTIPPADDTLPADTLLITELEPGEAGSESVEGEVRIVADATGSVRLSLQAAGIPAGNHAWHIHEGACGASGDVRIALSPTDDQPGIAGPLQADDGGETEAQVVVDGLDPTAVGAGAHSLHVHEHEGPEHGGTVACATI